LHSAVILALEFPKCNCFAGIFSPCACRKRVSLVSGQHYPANRTPPANSANAANAANAANPANADLVQPR
jgi:hypothetical protein